MKQKRKFLFFLPTSIKGQMIIMVSVLVFLQIGVSVIIFNSLISDFLEESLGKRAVDIARTISRMPSVKNALLYGDNGGELQNIISEVRDDTGARFIVVGKPDGTRLTHPFPDRIGKKFVGGDYYRAIENNEYYVSRSVGTLGPSMRAFAPVESFGQVIGFVSVGYLETRVSEFIRVAQKEPMVYFFMMMFVGLIAASIIANYVKWVTLGLEPHEIASIHKEREIILNSIREGIVACDRNGKVKFTNNEASRLLEVENPEKYHIDDLIPQAYVLQRLHDMTSANDEEIMVGGRIMVFNITPVSIKDRPAGVVASFRRKDEMDYLNNELRQARQCSDMLRMQSHEYSNKLHAISGLLQIEEYDEAKDLILKESEGYHRLLEYVDNSINCSVIGGLILGKYNKASELKCGLKVDFSGGLYTPPKYPEYFVTIIGNLLDNAIHAAKENKNADPVVYIGIYEKDSVYKITVEDSGKGIMKDIDIFAKGVSTKVEGHGIGLYNLSMAVNALEGEVSTSDSSLGGAKFVVEIPKG
jgi:two-component system CitB family sensor kinase/two-component system sensor histidine kinase DcuS